MMSKSPTQQTQNSAVGLIHVFCCGAGALGCDPMQMWYLHHYGRSEAHAAADAQQRAAERAADAQQHAAAAAAAADAQAAAAQHREARESEEGRQQHRSAVPSVPRWWQDPAQVEIAPPSRCTPHIPPVHELFLFALPVMYSSCETA